MPPVVVYEADESERCFMVPLQCVVRRRVRLRVVTVKKYACLE